MRFLACNFFLPYIFLKIFPFLFIDGTVWNCHFTMALVLNKIKILAYSIDWKIVITLLSLTLDIPLFAFDRRLSLEALFVRSLEYLMRNIFVWCVLNTLLFTPWFTRLRRFENIWESLNFETLRIKHEEYVIESLDRFHCSHFKWFWKSLNIYFVKVVWIVIFW